MDPLYKFLAAIGWILCGYFCLLLFSDLNAYYACWGSFSGKTPLAYGRRTLRTVAKSRFRFALYAPLLALIPVNATYFLSKFVIPLPYSLALVLFQLHIWVYQSVPPTVLLLGNSRLQTIRLRERLERGLHPYRVIVFLDASVVSSGSLTRFQDNLLRWDNFRTANVKDWRTVVHPIMNFVPILVIDTRVASPFVVEEVCHALDKDLAHKTVFLAGSDGQAPALDAAGIQPKRDLIFTQEEALVARLKGMGLDRVVSPDDLFR
jgi:hypothetical protein